MLYDTVPPVSTVSEVLRFGAGAAFSSSGWTSRVTVAVSLPPRPSSTSYEKLDVPEASSGTAICSDAPLKICCTVPMDGCWPATVATRTSPSGSLSLSMTGRSAEPPGRTPNESSSATGGVLISLRSGRVDSTVSCVESSSFSVSPSGGVRSFQLSTRCRLSFASHAAPPTASFRMMTSRLTRKTRLAESAPSGMVARTSLEVPSQSRTNAADPAHAP